MSRSYLSDPRLWPLEPVGLVSAGTLAVRVRVAKPYRAAVARLHELAAVDLRRCWWDLAAESVGALPNLFWWVPQGDTAQIPFRHGGWDCRGSMVRQAELSDAFPSRLGPTSGWWSFYCSPEAHLGAFFCEHVLAKVVDAVEFCHWLPPGGVWQNPLNERRRVYAVVHPGGLPDVWAPDAPSFDPAGEFVYGTTARKEQAHRVKERWYRAYNRKRKEILERGTRDAT